MYPESLPWHRCDNRLVGYVYRQTNTCTFLVFYANKGNSCWCERMAARWSLTACYIDYQYHWAAISANNHQL